MTSDLFTIAAGSGGVRASRFAANFDASLAVCELPFATISSETTGGVGGTPWFLAHFVQQQNESTRLITEGNKKRRYKEDEVISNEHSSDGRISWESPVPGLKQKSTFISEEHGQTRLLRRRTTRPAGKKPDPSHENCSQQKALEALRAEEQPEELQDSPLVPGFTNAAGFSGSPWNSNPPEILSPSLLDFPSLALSPVVCARCHGLRNYGKVKDQTVENLLPDFDFDHTVERRLNSVTGTRAVVVMVVDAVDFDGSFPRKVAELVSNTIDVNSRAWKEGKSENLPDLRGVMQGYDI
ncbi:hypothetical protein L1987_34658 [Smallanthus sonchifolius]|uniref:Uncharacterized protein n=1 Tax=Smallanthus sonchifolius TaxID=185202 RepID=A0ACB9HU98_9ASTR|nr:hypothetical protein L1987_34658 [Smallanthus sonchifolius]